MRTSVNRDTDFMQASPCEMCDAMPRVLRRDLYLRQTFGPTAGVLLSKVDVKEGSSQVPADPSKSGFVLDVVAVADLQLDFGWRISPGIWGLLGASCLGIFSIHTLLSGQVISDVARETA